VTEEQILAVLGALHEIDVTIGGGWGIDALLGHQTRPHHDVDLLVREEQFDAARATLLDAGFCVVLDEFPDRVILESPALGRVDLNNLVYNDAGDAYQRGEGGWFETFPRWGFTEGRLAGMRVRCLTPAVQLAKHEGYPLRSFEAQDLQLLRRLAGVDEGP
jgi:lincosamide nucleotidyltransferase A/C/D/E